MARSFYQELNSLDKSADKMMNMLTAVAMDITLVDTWASVLSKVTTYGAREYFSKDRKEAEAHGIDERAIQELEMLTDSSPRFRNIDREPWHIAGLKDIFVTECRKEYVMKLGGLDPLTQLGAMTGFSVEGHDADDFNLYNPEVWTAWSKRRGANAVGKGGVKSGKTNSFLTFSEYHLKKGYRVASNVYVDTENVPAEFKGYRFCPTLSSQLREICYARKDGVECLVGYDEGGLYWNKIQTVQPRNIDQSKLLVTYGKFHTNVWFIAHFESMVPTIMATTAVLELDKTTPSTGYISIKEGMKLSYRPIINIPPTVLPYDPDQFQYFRIDLHVDSLFEFASSLTGGEEQWDEILDYVKRHAGERTEEAIDPKVFARELHKTYHVPVRQIAAIMSKPKSTIYDWVKDVSWQSDKELAET